MRLRRTSNRMATAFYVLTAYLVCVQRVQAAPAVKNAAPSVTQASNAPSGVPDYVIKYAPLVYLHPEEVFKPSDVGAQIANTTPKLDKQASVPGAPTALNVDNLDLLNAYGTKGTNIYLTSNSDPSTNPAWMDGVTPDAAGKTNGAISAAVIVADKGNGLVDAFYMYFYAYNWGGIVLDQNLGNHVGDWEHNMVRFQNGVPTAVWYSQHSAGQAFTYKSVLKDSEGLRPIVFSANGSHANYGISGDHDHTIGSVIPGLNLPGQGIITDYTGYGNLWDPIKSAYWYSFTGPTSSTVDSSPTKFNSKVGTFTAYDAATSPDGWLYYQGRWGDQQYPNSDKRQKQFLGQYKWASGPTGPAYKNLVRKNVWPGGSGFLSPVLTA